MSMTVLSMLLNGIELGVSMGFSLKMFFQELEEALKEASDRSEALDRLRDIIEFNKQYAIECGQLK